MSEQLAGFMRNLTIDPGLLEAFNEDRAAVLADADLPAADKAFLLEGNPEEWRRLLSDEAPPVPGTL
jgi:hypothetical protein